ncbi:hypothetical protein NPIL_6961 [Nephila pilipes]|uniref:Uncharacterized protein n=1 Tax=Nephila pilipes TaxID=299642 RepID=A0A8X6U8E1_NEPPI|nr:hypothetical protein NPIL_6961 [Nephila pilipes]
MEIYFNNTIIGVSSLTFVKHLKESITILALSRISAYNSKTVFVHKNLNSTYHVYQRYFSTNKAFESVKSSPHQVLSRDLKTYRIVVNNRKMIVNIDRLKLAFLWAPEHSTTISSPTATSPVSSSPPAVVFIPPVRMFPYVNTPFSRYVKFPSTDTPSSKDVKSLICRYS